MASNWFMDTMSGVGDFMGDMASGVGNMFSGWGTPTPSKPGMGTMPTPKPNYSQMSGPMTAGAQAAVPEYHGGAMAMPQTYDPAAIGAAKPVGGTPAEQLETFKSGLTKAKPFSFGTPEGYTQIGDYLMNADQVTQYSQLKKDHGAVIDQWLGIASPDAPNWFQSKGVPLAKMGLAGGSLYLGSKTADAFKKQMEASQQVAQKNIENQTALINTYMYDRQAARYAANPEGEQTPEEYMAEHGL